MIGTEIETGLQELEVLLSQGDWLTADAVTLEIMLATCQRRELGWLDQEAIALFFLRDAASTRPALAVLQRRSFWLQHPAQNLSARSGAIGLRLLPSSRLDDDPLATHRLLQLLQLVDVFAGCPSGPPACSLVLGNALVSLLADGRVWHRSGSELWRTPAV